jgi:hypothetical protein
MRIAGEYHMAKRPLALPASPSGNQRDPLQQTLEYSPPDSMLYELSALYLNP